MRYTWASCDASDRGYAVDVKSWRDLETQEARLFPLPRKATIQIRVPGCSKMQLHAYCAARLNTVANGWEIQSILRPSYFKFLKPIVNILEWLYTKRVWCTSKLTVLTISENVGHFSRQYDWVTFISWKLMIRMQIGITSRCLNGFGIYGPSQWSLPCLSWNTRLSHVLRFRISLAVRVCIFC